MKHAVVPANQMSASVATSRPRAVALVGDPGLDFFVDLWLPEGDEDRQACKDFLEGVRLAVEPEDVIDELECNRIATLAWDALCLRRYRAALLKSLAPTGVRAALAGLIDYSEIKGIAIGWAKREPAAVKKVEELLEPIGTPHLIIEAQTWRVNAGIFEAIDKLTMQYDASRRDALRELERHRAALAQRLRRKLDAEDAEHEDVAKPEAEAPE